MWGLKMRVKHIKVRYERYRKEFMKAKFACLVFCVVGGFYVLSASEVNANNANEDMMIVMGLDSLYHNDFAESRDDFLLLFEETKNPYYAKLAAQAAAAIGDLQTSMNLALLYQKLTGDTNDLQINKVLADGYTKNGDINKAIEVLEKVKQQEPSLQVLKILANLYLLQKNLPKSLELFDEIYKEEKDEESLVKMILIHITQNQPQKAIDMLSAHLLSYGCSDMFCEESLKIYSDLNALQTAKEVFKQIYTKNPTIPNATNFMRILVSLKQYQEAQGIAESFPFDKGLLLDLYVMQGDYTKAYKQAERFYKESKNPKFLALQAVYEISANQNISKQKAIEASKKLEKAIKERKKELQQAKQKPTTQDAFFYNFVGYLMIDYEIDIKKGIAYVKDALALESNSVAYLDSLAWGYYKIGQCKEALNVFLRIPKNAIEADSDLKAHAVQIQSCTQ